MKPRGPAVRFAASAAPLGVGSMLVAATASGTAAIALYLFVRSANRTPVYLQSFQRYGSTVVLVGYLVLVTVLAAVAVVSASRGARAAHADR
jgi:hypothetical protein